MQSVPGPGPGRCLHVSGENVESNVAERRRKPPLTFSGENVGKAVLGPGPGRRLNVSGGNVESNVRPVVG